jgi:hypothetical protein
LMLVPEVIGSSSPSIFGSSMVPSGGATNQTLILPSLQPAHQGMHSLVASNSRAWCAARLRWSRSRCPSVLKGPLSRQRIKRPSRAKWATGSSSKHRRTAPVATARHRTTSCQRLPLHQPINPPTLSRFYRVRPQ